MRKLGPKEVKQLNITACIMNKLIPWKICFMLQVRKLSVSLYYTSPLVLTINTVVYMFALKIIIGIIISGVRGFFLFTISCV
jgi:hypothetical protein